MKNIKSDELGIRYMDNLIAAFLLEANDQLDQADNELIRYDLEPGNSEIANSLFHIMHTIKGACSFLNFNRLSSLINATENAIDKLRESRFIDPNILSLIMQATDRIRYILARIEQTGDEPLGSDEDLLKLLMQVGVSAPKDLESEIITELSAVPPSPASIKFTDAIRPVPGSGRGIRIPMGILDNLMCGISELVLTRDRLVASENSRDFKSQLQQLHKLTTELHFGILQTRMQPVGNAWKKLPHLVHDLAIKLGKRIHLQISGQYTELDRQLLSAIESAITQLIRNAADHGIETPEKREELGKPPKGTIHIAAQQTGNQIIITVIDDGSGFNAESIKERALAEGLVTKQQLNRMSIDQVHQLVFCGSLPSKQKDVDISGRGIGMHLLKTIIESTGGSVNINTVPLQGTTITLKVPLTMATISVLVVQVSGMFFAIPQSSIYKVVVAKPDSEPRICYLSSKPSIIMRGQAIPIACLSSLLNLHPATEKSKIDQSSRVILVEENGVQIGIPVDTILQTEDIIIKPLSTLLRHISVFSGQASLRSGELVLVLDPHSLSIMLMPSVSEGSRLPSVSADHLLSDTTSSAEENPVLPVLLFKTDTGDTKAIQTSFVARVEAIPDTAVSRARRQNVIQWHGLPVTLHSASDLFRADSTTNGTGSGSSSTGIDKQKTTLSQNGRRFHFMLMMEEADLTIGLVVENIIDIIEVDPQLLRKTKRLGLLGSSVVDGFVFDIVDVKYFFPSALEAPFPADRLSSSSAYSVLLVGTSSSYHDILLTTLKEYENFTLTVCVESVEALELLDSGFRFDMVIAGISMSEASKLEFATALKASSALWKTHLLSFSLDASPDRINKLLQAGFDDCITQLDRGTLKALLERALDRKVRAAA